jgi:dTDP-4-dehydrorhamnose 3,5-epimerase
MGFKKEMNDNKIDFVRLETHETHDITDNHVNGLLTVVWRDWDKIIPTPKMIYLSAVNPHEIKGPHLHTKRNSYFLCIKGKVVFIIKDLEGNYHEIISSETEPNLIQIPKNFPSAHINIVNEPSTILTLADIAWKPNNNEMQNTTFDDYDWKKWE